MNRFMFIASMFDRVKNTIVSLDKHEVFCESVSCTVEIIVVYKSPLLYQISADDIIQSVWVLHTTVSW